MLFFSYHLFHKVGQRVPLPLGSGGNLPCHLTGHWTFASVRFIYGLYFINTMKTVATIKLKIRNSKELIDMSNTFLQAVQYSIDKGFKAKVSNRFKLHHLVYKDLRQWLPSDFACEAIAKASENLKSTKFKKKPIMKSCPISFNRNLFTFSFEKVRIATFTPRQRKDVAIDIPKYYWKYLDWRYQTLEIIKDRKGRMFFHITFSRQINSNITSRSNGKVIGVDLGINNLAVCSNGKVFKTPKTRLRQFHYLRKRLQSKGTKSAKRRLKVLSGRQKRFMRHYNHIVSKAIVSNADVIVMEDLKGIRKQRKGRRFNRWLNNWAFYQLQGFTKYKAEREGKLVVFKNPYKTSIICSKCLSENTSRFGDYFLCLHCGNDIPSDLNASFNLRRLYVTKPHNSVDDTKGQLTTAVDIRVKSPTL